MAQTGFTPVQLYHSTTAAATPSAGNLANGELAVNITDGRLFYKDNGGVVRVLATAAGSAGDVVGPGSSTDNALVRFDGTTGKLVQNSAGVLSDAGALSGLTSVAATTFTGALTGNASTATTLQTSRTIWGQSFDGSANVTGALTGVTDLTASGSLTLNGGTANGVVYANGSKVLTSGSALTFDGTNLGLGTATPQNYGAGVTSATIDASSTSSIDLRISGTRYGRVYASTSALNIDTWSGTGPIVFGINTNEQMRLTSTGLGIGTSSPAYKLDVSATGTTVSSAFRSDQSQMWVMLKDSGTALGNVRIGSEAGSFIAYANGNQLVYNSSGNLGLGVTPSAWAAIYKNIDLNTSSSIGATATQLDVGYNFFWNGTNNVYKVSGQNASTYRQRSSGEHIWYTAPSGTAGNAISFTQAMSLTAAGELLVGVTSAAAQGGLTIYPTGSSGGPLLVWNRASTTNTTTAADFRNAETSVGNISFNNTSTSYVTSSDYRLKNITGPITTSGAYIDSLNPVEGTWKADGSTFVGLIAHEVQEASRTQVATGVKDGEQMQGMDYSSAEIIANLIAEVKALRTRVAALEAA